MNYLAHFFLAFDNADRLLGQYMGDYVKGRRYEEYPSLVKEGILLHRFVDHTTDTSPLTLEIRDILRVDLGKYTGIALDVFFDHFLALNWNSFHVMPLQDFIRQVYSQLSNRELLMNDEMKNVLNYMKKFDWLGRYKEIAGIDITLSEMSKRMPMGNTLFKAPQAFRNQYSEVERAFLTFFPQLITDSKAKLDTFATP